jgi:N-acetylated-alpha-linked acidic dipeptidase
MWFYAALRSTGRLISFTDSFSKLMIRNAFPLLLCTALLHAQSPIRGFAPDQWKTQRELEAKALAMPEPARIRAYMERMAAEPHHAGSPGSKAVAQYARALMREWGIDARIDTFEALLPYPTSRTLQLTAPLKYTARLKEPAIAEDPDSSDENQLPTYNAYSASGDVTAPLVYVNYGVPEDYEYLRKQGIDVKDKIVIVRYGRSWRGVKPKLAQENGAVGCIIYSDPREDGYFQGDPYPKGPTRPEHGVQRGSVMDMAVYAGDPLSPGWASEKGAKRLTRAEAKTVLKIPVLPISYADAKPLLESLGGPMGPESWRGALPIPYHIGPGPATVRLEVDFDWSVKPVHNVIGLIPGASQKEQWIIYGNHHDAWVNGASDPISGAAALLETARVLAEMQRQGWQPQRTIVLALWDAEEFGLVGSTEWAEKNREQLVRKGVVYLNSDSNGRGALGIGGSHALEPFFEEIARDNVDPATRKSLLETPRRRSGEDNGPFRLAPLGAGSDYVAFFHHLGISSANLGFGGADVGGVYHSIYDSLAWYKRFSDPDLVYGRALAQVMLTTILRLSESAILPFDFSALARTARRYADELDKQSGSNGRLDLKEVYAQIAALESAGKQWDEAASAALKRTRSASPEKLAALNEVIYRAERSLLLPDGLPRREWYKHQLYAPGLYTGYGAKTMPGIREALEAGRWEEANVQAGRLAQALKAYVARAEEATRLARSL